MALACTFCSESFPSRNVLFRHLRDPANACGAQTSSLGGIPLGPSKSVSKADKRQSLLNTSGAVVMISSMSNKHPNKPKQKKTKKKKRMRESMAFTTSHTQELWFGGIPSKYGSKSALSVVLWNGIRPGEPTPIIKTVIRKGWRQRVDGEVGEERNELAVEEEEEEEEAKEDGKSTDASKTTTTKKKKVWVGYAILAFRNDQEAQEALSLFQGRELERGFVMRLKPAEAERKTKARKISKSMETTGEEQEGEDDFQPRQEEVAEKVPLALGADPATWSQVKPLRSEQLIKRLSSLQRWYNATATREKDQEKEGEEEGEEEGVEECKALALMAIASCQPMLRSDDTERQMRDRLSIFYRQAPRPTCSRAGHLAPSPLYDSLLNSLIKLQWPAKRHRPSIHSEHYIVMWRGRPRPGLEELHQGCENLMAWADSTFLFTHVAVTKNFVGSPHVDNLDQTYQYTMSLGPFTIGGELCVECESEKLKGSEGEAEGEATTQQEERSPDGTRVEVVDTHGRVASMDGRFVHWVRGHDGGDRYSLVFYSLDPAAETEPSSGIRVFRPTGEEGQDGGERCHVHVPEDTHDTR